VNNLLKKRAYGCVSRVKAKPILIARSDVIVIAMETTKIVNWEKMTIKQWMKDH